MTTSIPLQYFFLEGQLVGPTPIVEGTNDTTVVAYEVNDATKDFNVEVSVGDIVVNDAGAFATVLTVAATKLTLDTDLALVNLSEYDVLFSEEAFNVTATATNDKPFSMFLNVGDRLSFGLSGSAHTTFPVHIVALWDDVMTLNRPLLIGSIPAGYDIAITAKDKMSSISLDVPFIDVTVGVDSADMYVYSTGFLISDLYVYPNSLRGYDYFQAFRNAIEAAGRNKWRNTNAPMDRLLFDPGNYGLYLDN
mgnify:CR=1 FL=1|tara:strand:- start:1994 stop:2743 length:750 start_codon:yes stop_codon:yes gene_type:complete